MGSAKQPETLQLLNQEVVPEDAHQANHSSSPCHQEEASFLPNSKCDGADLTMRNCCVNDLCTKASSQGDAMVDSPNKMEKVPVVDTKPPVDLSAVTARVALTCTGAGEKPLKGEGVGETAVSSDLQYNSRKSLSMKELPISSANTSDLLAKKAFEEIDHAAEKESAGDACRHLLAEPCLKGTNKDSSSAPASLKHVAFLEPTKNNVETEGVRAGTVQSEVGPAPSTCLQKARQSQPSASTAVTAQFSSDSHEAVECLSEGGRKTVVSGPSKESISAKSGKTGTEMNQAGHSGEMGSAVNKPNTGVISCIAAETSPATAAAVDPHEVKPQETLGESQTTPGQATEEKEGLRDATASSTKEKNQAQEQQNPESTTVGKREDHTTSTDMRSVELLAKTCSFEITPPQHDAETQADNRVSLVSVAVSPINPPDGCTAFSFHTRGLVASSLKSPVPEQKPTKRDVEMQVSILVETRSVATGPMTPVAKSPQASYPEVHVKGAQEEAPEPVREVSWDEKGMTWEVYGASMEVEVLGMAIQKHLEKQIEEHGRQIVMTPQSTRASSIKGAPRKGEIKRQPSMFRALLQNMRRPRCCSRGGPAME